jgi:hypothetical protein
MRYKIHGDVEEDNTFSVELIGKKKIEEIIDQKLSLELKSLKQTTEASRQNMLELQEWNKILNIRINRLEEKLDIKKDKKNLKEFELKFSQ